MCENGQLKGQICIWLLLPIIYEALGHVLVLGATLWDKIANPYDTRYVWAQQEEATRASCIESEHGRSLYTCMNIVTVCFLVNLMISRKARLYLVV